MSQRDGTVFARLPDWWMAKLGGEWKRSGNRWRGRCPVCSGSFEIRAGGAGTFVSCFGHECSQADIARAVDPDGRKPAAPDPAWDAEVTKRRRAEAEKRAELLDSLRQRFDAAKRATEVPAYLRNKGYDWMPKGVRVDSDGITLVPMYRQGGALFGAQELSRPNKPFAHGSQSAGTHVIVANRGTARFYLGEGVGTCMAVSEGLKSTEIDGTVIAAFCAANLKTVGADTRAKYPEAEIVLTADNDRWTKGNPGVTKARAAAKACKGAVAIPEFADLEGKPTDYDDLRRREGLEAVRTWLDPKMSGRAKTIGWSVRAKAAPEPEAPPSDDKAQDKEVVTGRYNDPRTFIAAGIAAGAEWYYDLRRDRALRKSGDDWTEVNDRWATDLPYQIGERVRRRDTSRHYKDLHYAQAMAKRLFTASLYRLERDPFREWLEQLPAWDGVPALDRWLELLEPVGDIGLIRWAAANIVLLAIWRTYQPGTGCKQTVMLRGPSNGGKSSILECLMPPGSPDWFRGSLPMQRLSISPKDVVEHCKGAVVVEWSEMAGIGGGRHQVDVESLKAFLSASRDSGVRFAYRRDPEDLPRNYVIVGTANRNVTLPDDRALLNRIVPITCTATDRHDWRAEIERYMDANRERIWAEALARYHEGVTPTLPHDLRIVAAKVANKVRLGDPDVQTQWDEKRYSDWSGKWFIEWSEIRKGFSSDISSDRIRRFIESKGWTYSRPRRDLVPRRFGYVHPDGRPE